MIKIKEIDKSKVFALLYNNAKVKMIGMYEKELNKISPDQARKLLEIDKKFVCLNGKYLNLDFSSNIFSSYKYNKENKKTAETILKENNIYFEYVKYRRN